MIGPAMEIVHASTAEMVKRLSITFSTTANTKCNSTLTDTTLLQALSETQLEQKSTMNTIKESFQVSLTDITNGRVTEGISPNNTHLRPDIIYLDADNEVTVIEIGVSHNQERNRNCEITNTLEDKHKEKKWNVLNFNKRN